MLNICPFHKIKPIKSAMDGGPAFPDVNKNRCEHSTNIGCVHVAPMLSGPQLSI